jgi:hypothetical protein
VFLGSARALRALGEAMRLGWLAKPPPIGTHEYWPVPFRSCPAVFVPREEAQRERVERFRAVYP